MVDYLEVRTGIFSPLSSAMYRYISNISWPRAVRAILWCKISLSCSPSWRIPSLSVCGTAGGALPGVSVLAESLGKDINQLTLQSIYTEAKNEGSGDRAEALVDDVIQVLIRHIQGDDYNENLLYGVLFGLSSLRSDLMINSHLRTCIFMPMLATLRQARQQGIHTASPLRTLCQGISSMA